MERVVRCRILEELRRVVDLIFDLLLGKPSDERPLMRFGSLFWRCFHDLYNRISPPGEGFLLRNHEASRPVMPLSFKCPFVPDSWLIEEQRVRFHSFLNGNFLDGTTWWSRENWIVFSSYSTCFSESAYFSLPLTHRRHDGWSLFLILLSAFFWNSRGLSKRNERILWPLANLHIEFDLTSGPSLQYSIPFWSACCTLDYR